MTDVIVGSGTSASQGSGTCFSDGLSRGCGESSVVLSFLRGICILLSITVYRYMWVSTTFWKTDISSIRDIETSYVFPISAPGHLSQRGNVPPERRHVYFTPDEIPTKARYEDIWNQRLKTLQQHCQGMPRQNGPNTTKLQLQLLVDRQHQLLYCPIPKAGTNSVKNLLCISDSNETYTKVKKPTHCHHSMSMYHEEVQRHFLTKYVTLVVLRHPMDRLVSAFNDKMTHNREFSPWYKLHIIAKYRYGRSKTLRFYQRLFRMTGASTLEEVIGKINSTGNNTTLSWPLSPSDQLLITEAVTQPVTFSEFVSFTLEHSDIHWMSYDRLCPLCDLHNPNIVKIETMVRDWSRIVLRQNFSQEIGHKHLLRHSGWQTTNNCIFFRYLPEMRTLEDALIVRLLKKHSSDMKMFGYSWDQSKLLAYCGSADSGHCC